MSQLKMWAIPENAIDRVLADVPLRGSVCEWGMGGSTERLLVDCEKRESHLISFENNAGWFNKMTKRLLPSSRWTPLLYERRMMSAGDAARIDRDFPSIRDMGIDRHLLHSQQESAVELGDYVNARVVTCEPKTSVIPDCSLFFVDGYARGPCIASVHALAPPGSVLWLHDAVRTGWYDWALELPRFKHHDLDLDSMLLRVEVE